MMRFADWAVPTFRALGAVSLVVALVSAGVGAWWYEHNRAWVQHAATAQGTVIRLDATTGADGGTMYKPVVRFTSGRGVETTFTTHWATNPPAYSVGDAVRVLYTPGDPGDAAVGSGVWVWIGPMVLGVVAVAFTFNGLMMLLLLPLVIRKGWGLGSLVSKLSRSGQ